MKVAWYAWGPVVVCALSLALFGWTFKQRAHDQRALEQVATQTNEALCTFKEDLQRRYDSGVEFLEKNPGGIPGISSADIARSLANQRATLDSLASLECQ